MGSSSSSLQASVWGSAVLGSGDELESYALASRARAGEAYINELEGLLL